MTMDEVKAKMSKRLDLADDILKELRVRWTTNELQFCPKGHYGFAGDDFTLTYNSPEWDRFWKKGDALFDVFIDSVYSYVMLNSIMAAEQRLDQDGVDVEALSVDDWLSLSFPISIAKGSNTRCGECNDDTNQCIEYLNGTIFVAGDQCQEPGGISGYEVELKVPSGKIVFANDLRKLFGDPNEHAGKYLDVNYNCNIKATSEAYADMGMIHAFVGNSCPSVYQMAPDHIEVGSYFNFDTDEDKHHDNVVGSICTDLWWFSAMDYDEYITRIEQLPLGADISGDVDVVDVTPGTYTAKCYISVEEFGGAEQTIYCNLQKKED